MSNGHYIEKCKECDKVISRCRCMGPHEIKYSTCEECKTKTADMTPIPNNKPQPAPEPHQVNGYMKPKKVSVLETPAKLANEIDAGLIDRDEHKPLRKAVDNVIAPAAGIAGAAVMGAAGAVANLKQTSRLKQVL